jgi:hypothetical protein
VTPYELERLRERSALLREARRELYVEKVTDVAERLARVELLDRIDAELARTALDARTVAGDASRG